MFLPRVVVKLRSPVVCVCVAVLSGLALPCLLSYQGVCLCPLPLPLPAGLLA